MQVNFFKEFFSQIWFTTIIFRNILDGKLDLLNSINEVIKKNTIKLDDNDDYSCANMTEYYKSAYFVMEQVKIILFSVKTSLMQFFFRNDWIMKAIQQECHIWRRKRSWWNIWAIIVPVQPFGYEFGQRGNQINFEARQKRAGQWFSIIRISSNSSRLRWMFFDYVIKNKQLFPLRFMAPSLFLDFQSWNPASLLTKTMMCICNLY